MSLSFVHSPSALPRYPDVTVIGAGIVGLAAAFFLNRKNIRPLLIERLPSPASLTSRRSGEGIRAQWELPHNIAITLEAIELYRAFGDLTGHDAGYTPLGYLYASRSRTGASALAARVERQRAAGLPGVEYLSADAARSRFPILAEDVAGAAFRQEDGVIDVARVIAGYTAALDADILLGTTVDAVTEDAGGVRLDTSSGTIVTGKAVLADGARLGLSLAQLGVDIPVRTAAATLQFVRVEGIPQDHPATVDTDIGSFWRRNADGARLTASFRGMSVVGDGIDNPAPEPDYLNHAIRTVAPMVPLWHRLAPHITDCHTRSGTFALTEDGAPLIGRLPSFRHIFLNGGYGSHGVMMSPAGGRWLADIVAGHGGEANPFDPQRFLDGTPEPEPMTIHLNPAFRTLCVPA